MQCTNCGHERPRTGNCPNCGEPAPAPNSRGNDSWGSRGQRLGDRNGSYSDSPSRSRPLDDSRRGSSYGGGRGDPRQGSYSRYPDESRTPSRPRSPNDSYNRGSRSPNQSYPRDPNASFSRRSWGEAVDDDRAMIVAPPSQVPVMPTNEQAIAFPRTEEEERALGIRRPAFIPATDERIGERPSGTRVISGVLSMILLMVGVCGITGFLLRDPVSKTFAQLTGARPKGISIKPTVIPQAFLQNQTLATPAPNKTDALTQITTSKIANKTPTGYDVQQITALFYPNDTVNVVSKWESGSKAGDVINIKWIYNDIDISPDACRDNKGVADKDKPATDRVCEQTLDTEKGEFVLFKLTLPPASTGRYQAQILYNGNLTTTVVFLAANPPATPTPVPPTATPKPTK